MTRKIICAAVLAAAAVAFVPTQAEAVPIVSLSTSTPSISLGDTLSIQANISDVTDLYAWQFDLSYSPTLSSPGNSTEGSFLSDAGGTFFVQGLSDGLGNLSFNSNTLLTAISGASGSGTLASFDFSSLLVGTETFTLSNLLLLDSSLNLIDAGVQNLSVQIRDTTADVPEPAVPLLLITGLALGLVSQRARLRAGSGSAAI